MPDRIENWLGRVGSTLNAVRGAPRDLYDRIKYVAEMIRDAGPVSTDAVLLLRSPDGRVHILPIGNELVIGRESMSLQPLAEDVRLSRRHFRIVGHRLEDLSSLNHTFVNDTKVTTCELKDGDVIAAGHQTFVFLKKMERLTASL